MGTLYFLNNVAGRFAHDPGNFYLIILVIFEPCFTM